MSIPSLASLGVPKLTGRGDDDANDATRRSEVDLLDVLVALDVAKSGTCVYSEVPSSTNWVAMAESNCNVDGWLMHKPCTPVPSTNTDSGEIRDHDITIDAETPVSAAADHRQAVVEHTSIVMNSLNKLLRSNDDPAARWSRFQRMKTTTNGPTYRDWLSKHWNTLCNGASLQLIKLRGELKAARKAFNPKKPTEEAQSHVVLAEQRLEKFQGRSHYPEIGYELFGEELLLYTDWFYMDNPTMTTSQLACAAGCDALGMLFVKYLYSDEEKKKLHLPFEGLFSGSYLYITLICASSGKGSTLLKVAEAVAAKLNCKSIVLSTMMTQATVAWYHKKEFQFCSRSPPTLSSQAVNAQYVDKRFVDLFKHNDVLYPNLLRDVVDLQDKLNTLFAGDPLEEDLTRVYKEAIRKAEAGVETRRTNREVANIPTGTKRRGS